MIPLQPDWGCKSHRERVTTSEAQLRKENRPWGGCGERNCDLMDDRRIEGAAKEFIERWMTLPFTRAGGVGIDRLIKIVSPTPLKRRFTASKNCGSRCQSGRGRLMADGDLINPLEYLRP